ncbi:oligosaccharide flippase family protein [Geomonas sp. Red32]|uniref:oligosaccharide flippase family protein n=1 Tax=Geomonas sp. Red32 TaxID=2912856 RepID=UPI00202CBC99|nr:oligosaccharide flippase family protein [Geomonas sp. Red32]MCM0084045.1 oligosaccharide flippase family protein [Geomonas sp. Red32]
MKLLFRKIQDLIQTTFLGTRRAIEDVVVSMVPQAVSVVTGFLTSILVARGLGPKGMGSYALILSVSGLAAALSDLGISQTAIRFASRAADNHDREGQFAVLRWAFRLRMLLVVAVSLLAFIFAPVVADRIWHEQSLAGFVRISLLIGLFSALASIPTIYFQSLKRFKMNAVVSVGQTLAAFVGILAIAVKQSWSIDHVIWVSVVAGGLGAIVFMVLVPRDSFLRSRDFDRPLSSLPMGLLRAPRLDSDSTMDKTGANSFAFFMVLSSILVSVTLRADVWLMGFFLDKADVGRYSVATRFTLPLVIVLGALNTALWPRASALVTLEKTVETMKKTLKMSVLLSLGAVAYSIIAPLATPYVFGSTYAQGILLAQILCIRYCLSLLICPIGVIGYSFGMVRVYWVINLLQLLSVIGCNVFLLPRIGAVGAAWALVVNEIIGFVLSAVFIRRRILEMKRNESFIVKEISTENP